MKKKIKILRSNGEIYIPVKDFLEHELYKLIVEEGVDEVMVSSIYNSIDMSLELSIKPVEPGKTLYYYSDDSALIFEVVEKPDGVVIARRISICNERVETSTEYDVDSVLNLIDKMIEWHEYMIDGFSSADEIHRQEIMKLKKLRSELIERFKQ